MKRSILARFFIVAAFVALTAVAVRAEDAPAAEGAETPTYEGAAKCKLCHSSDKLAGTAYTVWAAGAHAKAFESLKSEKGLASAKELGVDDPTTDERCLKCHTTPTLKPEEGVSCEACHGPASLYLKPHGKKAEERPDHAALVAMGMTDHTDKAKNAEACMQCHRADPMNQFHKDFDYDSFWEQIKHGGKPQAAAPQGE